MKTIDLTESRNFIDISECYNGSYAFNIDKQRDFRLKKSSMVESLGKAQRVPVTREKKTAKNKLIKAPTERTKGTKIANVINMAD